MAAYAITGDVKYCDGAALGANWMHGSNPQERPYTTGIGHTPLTALLDLESWRTGGNMYDEPVPGHSIYGNIGAISTGMASRVFGLFQGSRQHTGDSYAGAAIAQMPPPWNY